jgi:hypothetical protein
MISLKNRGFFFKFRFFCLLSGNLSVRRRRHWAAAATATVATFQKERIIRKLSLGIVGRADARCRRRPMTSPQLKITQTHGSGVIILLMSLTPNTTSVNGFAAVPTSTIYGVKRFGSNSLTDVKTHVAAKTAAVHRDLKRLASIYPSLRTRPPLSDDL